MITSCWWRSYYSQNEKMPVLRCWKQDWKLEGCEKFGGGARYLIRLECKYLPKVERMIYSRVACTYTINYTIQYTLDVDI